MLRIETKLRISWGRHELESIRFNNREVKPINRAFKDKLELDNTRFDSISAGGNTLLGLAIPGRRAALQAILGGQDAWLVRSARYVINLPQFYSTIFSKTVPNEVRVPQVNPSDAVQVQFSILTNSTKTITKVDATGQASFHISENPLRANGRVDRPISPLNANGVWVFQTSWIDARVLQLARAIPGAAFLSCRVVDPKRASVYESPFVGFTALCRKVETETALTFDGSFKAGDLQWVSPLTNSNEHVPVYGEFALKYDKMQAQVRLEVIVQSFSPSQSGLDVKFKPASAPFYTG